MELETARRNAEKAKPVKKAAVSVRCMLSCDQQVSITFCQNNSKQLDAVIICIFSLEKYIIKMTHYPYSSDGGGEESNGD